MNTKDSITRAYDNAADAYAAQMWNEIESKNMDRVMLGWYASQIPAGQTVLEIGSGPGEVSGYLSRLGVNCIGTDLSLRMIEKAKQYFPGVRFEVQDFLHLSYPEDSFAGVVAFYAIVNLTLDEIETAFKEVQRVLQSGGLFLFTFHIYEGEEKRDIPAFFTLEGSPLTFYFFKVDDLKALVEASGFQIVDILIRYPYPGVEHPSKRSYFVVRKA